MNSVEMRSGNLFRGVLDSLTHGGPIALGAQYFKDAQLEQLKAMLITAAGCSIGAAGHEIAVWLSRQDLADALLAAVPN